MNLVPRLTKRDQVKLEKRILLTLAGLGICYLATGCPGATSVKSGLKSVKSGLKSKFDKWREDKKAQKKAKAEKKREKSTTAEVVPPTSSTTLVGTATASSDGPSSVVSEEAPQLPRFDFEHPSGSERQKRNWDDNLIHDELD